MDGFPKREVPADLLCPHSIDAMPYLTWITCWQDRVRKERMADILVNPAVAAKLGNVPPRPLTNAPLPPREYYPIGGRNPAINNSTELRKTLGPQTATPLSLNRATFFSPTFASTDASAVQASRIKASASAPALSPQRGGTGGGEELTPQELARLMRNHAQKQQRQRQGPPWKPEAHRWQDGFFDDRPRK
mmetsp:Transcript_25171/g.83989  ORF Transcript_25171/g.83989 Transcript_25171/m.83989 type:complete len:190 (-) Transcript_25171:37-606(-)